MELAGKIVVVTGASMGIGEAIAKSFADQGASVVMLSRDAGRVEAARARIGHSERTLAIACDVRHREEIDRAIGLTLHHFQRIDVWVNNAGHGLLDSVAQMEMAACREMFETNFFGAVSAMQAVIPVMRQQGGGAIINISSVAGHIPLPFHAAYSATKFALNAIGKAAGVELKKEGIHVLTVCPGYVRTAFGKNVACGERTKEGASGFGARDHRGTRGPRHDAGIFEAEEGSHCAVDDVRAGKDLSAFSGNGGAGDGEDGRVIHVRCERLSQLRQHSFHLALRMKVARAARRRDAVRQHRFGFGDSVGRASVCAAMK